MRLNPKGVGCPQLKHTIMNTTTLTEKWIKLDPLNASEFKETLQICHHAAQLPAMAGNYLVDPREDDSHSAMEYSSTRKFLVGRRIRGDRDTRVALDIVNLNLHILNLRLTSLGKFSLKGRTKEEAFDFLRKELMTHGVDTILMKMDLHFDIPDHPVGQGAKFEIKDPQIFQAHADIRSNAKYLLRFFGRIFKFTSEILVWPHHFDTGAILYTGFDDSGDYNATVGIGLAMPDELCNEPYFYVNHWSANRIHYPDTFPELKHGQWITTGYKGAILELGRITDSKSLKTQCEIAADFLSDAIEKSLELIR